MVPARIVTLKSLPLSANGKVELAALPEPPESPALSRLLEQPDASQQGLIDIWKDVLKREQVGLDDDFFELGGHSLLATQVVSRVPAVFGVELPVRAVFENPTIRQLAFQLDARAAVPDSQNSLRKILEEVGGMSEEEVNRELSGNP